MVQIRWELNYWKVLFRLKDKDLEFLMFCAEIKFYVDQLKFVIRKVFFGT